jgi:hypothetical protein
VLRIVIPEIHGLGDFLVADYAFQRLCLQSYKVGICWLACRAQKTIPA